MLDFYTLADLPYIDFDYQNKQIDNDYFSFYIEEIEEYVNEQGVKSLLVMHRDHLVRHD